VSDAQVRHPIFARFFNRLSPIIERDIGADRKQLLSGLSGRVVEIGAGNGVNFGHYPDTVTEVVAIEPEAYLRGKAEEAATRASVPVRVVAAVAGDLPLEPDSFDAAVATLVLCTVPDATGALSELRRVLKPAGELRFLEHVRAEQPLKARVQGFADRSGIWPLIGGGCHCSRTTVASIESAGYEVQELRSVDVGPSWGITNPHVIGVARARA
jgi:ubiquinone/menaquinone biosynthesis C-methylase UbiE